MGVEQGAHLRKRSLSPRAWLLIAALLAVAGGAAYWRSRFLAAANARLIEAVIASDASAVQAALDAGASPDARRAPTEQRGMGLRRGGRVKGVSALMLAADRPVEITRILLQRGADPNLVGSELGLWSALFYAVSAGSLDTARELLENGADANHRDQVGQNALGMAAGRGNLEMVRLLLDANADPNVQDLSGMTPLLHALMRAPRSRSVPCIEQLLERKASPNCNLHGASALLLAIQQKNVGAVRALLLHNVAVDGIFVRGKTPLEFARLTGNRQIVKMLETRKD